MKYLIIVEYMVNTEESKYHLLSFNPEIILFIHIQIYMYILYIFFSKSGESISIVFHLIAASVIIH